MLPVRVSAVVRQTQRMAALRSWSVLNFVVKMKQRLRLSSSARKSVQKPEVLRLVFPLLDRPELYSLAYSLQQRRDPAFLD